MKPPFFSASRKATLRETLANLVDNRMTVRISAVNKIIRRGLKRFGADAETVLSELTSAVNSGKGEEAGVAALGVMALACTAKDDVLGRVLGTLKKDMHVGEPSAPAERLQKDRTLRAEAA